MKLTYTFIENIMKVLFSIVIVQLLFISVGADRGCFSPHVVTQMLEYSAASATLATGGGLLLEYILKNEAK